jgi:pSer/pThr/pTyr-binding forkhead associated (FHA) protein
VDGIVVTLWLLRLGFLALLYLFLFAVVRILVRDLRAAVRESTTELGRLLVLASPAQEPEVGRVFRLDAVTTLGRDVNNDVVIEDPFASTDHAVLTFRGRSWYVEDLHSTNGTFVNGARVDGVGPVSFGDELQVGEVRLRLERSQR